MHQLDHLSYSSMSLLQTCGKAFMRRYIAGERGTKVSHNLVFGSAFHDTIEDSIAQIATGSVRQSIIDGMPDYFIKQLDRQIGRQIVDWQDSSLEAARDLGANMLESASVRAFVDSYRPMMSNDGQPAIEMKFSIRLPGIPIPFIGFIDLINDSGIPCDLKTSARRWGQYRADKELQATVYLEALDQMGAKRNKDKKFEYAIFVKKAPATPVERILTQRSKQDIAMMKSLFASLWHENVIKESYPQTGIGSWKCNPEYCDYFAQCFADEEE